MSLKCLGRDRCEVRLGSWRSSDASLSMKCLGRDRCEVRLGSWRSSDASRSMKCLGRDRCEVHLGLHLAWVIFSCFVSLRESYPTHPAEAASTCLVCRECQPCCASQNWKHPLRTLPVHWLQPKVCSSLAVFSIGQLHWWNVTEFLGNYKICSRDPDSRVEVWCWNFFGNS